MDAARVLEIELSLTTFLHEFDGCFGRRTTGRYLDIYVAGQLSDLDRESVEPMADAAGVPPRSLQEFLSLFRWDEAAVRDRLQRRVAARHGDPNSVGVIDEAGFAKKGNETACVQQQHCSCLGKSENCVVSVHLGYVVGGFHTLLDGELFLPEETWHQNRTRCRAAGISDEVVYRPKCETALAQLRRALANGVRFLWFTFDEGYGGEPAFLRESAGLAQNYVAEIPVNFVGWTAPPSVLYRDHVRNRALARGETVMGRPRRLPRLKVKHTPACEVRELLKHSPIVRRIPGQTYRVKQGTKGPFVWEAKCPPQWIKDEHGLPAGPQSLLIVRNVLKPDEVKLFLSDAPLDTPVETLLLVAFCRWWIERLFEDTKTELGLDHFEVRRYGAITTQPGQTGFDTRMPQQDRQQRHAPEHRDRVVIAATPPPATQRFEQPRVGNQREKLANGLDAGAVFECLPGEQRSGCDNLHPCSSTRPAPRADPPAPPAVSILHRNTSPRQGPANRRTRARSPPRPPPHTKPRSLRVTHRHDQSNALLRQHFATTQPPHRGTTWLDGGPDSA